ncbi:MAG: hypothetical protein WCE23_03340 [Candidatus Binatus sp.]|uniref:hypothetical protein n=1 Tax=Candidatus Binatus sp. TaxID=2811406 RepID=UPI003C796BC1
MASVMFLDREIDVDRLELASKLGISVVVERHGRFVRSNPKVHPALTRIFR